VIHAPDPKAAHVCIRSVREEFPDATHHCWAFLAGPPGITAHIGLSDAGEPHGTAGRPILNVLLDSGVGEIVTVVTRYFGGVRLGKGGLSRAYSGGVSQALETLRTRQWISLATVRVTVTFSAMDPLFRLLDDLNARGREERYGSEVEVVARIPRGSLVRLLEDVAAFTSGQGRIEVVNSAASDLPTE